MILGPWSCSKILGICVIRVKGTSRTAFSYHTYHTYRVLDFDFVLRTHFSLDSPKKEKKQKGRRGGASLFISAAAPVGTAACFYIMLVFSIHILPGVVYMVWYYTAAVRPCLESRLGDCQVFSVSVVEDPRASCRQFFQIQYCCCSMAWVETPSVLTDTNIKARLPYFTPLFFPLVGPSYLPISALRRAVCRLSHTWFRPRCPIDF